MTDPVRLHRLTALRHAALWHAQAVPQNTTAATIRDKRARRICAAYWAELERVNVARTRRLTAYINRRDRAQQLDPSEVYS